MAYQTNTTARQVAAMDHDAEVAWIYKHRLRYRSTADIAKLAALPPKRDPQGVFSLDGGLGKRLSDATIRRRIKEAAEVHTEELAELIPEYRGISLARLDELSATALGQIRRAAIALAHSAEQVGHDGFVHEKAEQVIDRAIGRLTSIEDRRAKLLGLDAPVEVAVTVAHYDAEAQELAAMLADAAKGKKAHHA